MSLSDFTVISKLGEGSYSSVLKVKRVSDGQVYALKKVRLLALKDKQKQNALNQVRILASIDSPYIISYKHAFIDESSNCLCVIMEYADGGDLQQRIEQMIRKRQFFEQQEVWKVINHMLNGLKVLHDSQIMHRDLKCANIFISEGNYKLGDLNVSKVMTKDLAYTQTGTPYYASPEVWRDQPYDSKSDIWSLGCAIYELCALKPPFQGKDMQSLFRKVQKGQFDRIPSRYSDELQKFLSNCLQLNARKRPNCSQLLNSIQSNNQKQQLKIQGAENITLLDTIKLPKNLLGLKDMLPKSKYSVTTKEEDSGVRIPSRKSQGMKRDRELNYALSLKKNISQRNMLPEIKPIIKPQPPAYIAPRNIYDEYKLKDVSKNLQLLNLLRQKQREKQLLQEKLKKNKEKQYDYVLSNQRAQSLLKQKNTPYNDVHSYGLPMPKEKDVRLPPINEVKSAPMVKDRKPVYEYVRPSWWG